MPKPVYLYSTHARWYACVCSTQTPPRSFAVVIRTPSRGECFAALPDGLTFTERIERTAQIVVEFYNQEDWYRLPNEIRCREAELTDELRRIFDEVPIRTDGASRCFPDLDASFAEHVG